MRLLAAAQLLSSPAVRGSFLCQQEPGRGEPALPTAPSLAADVEAPLVRLQLGPASRSSLVRTVPAQLACECSATYCFGSSSLIGTPPAWAAS